MLFCRVLGPIRIEIDGDEVELGGAVPRRLLSALTVYGGAPVSNSILAELVWGEDAPVDAVSTIRVVVHRLRAALGADRGCLESTGSGYRLALAPDSLDLRVFERLIEQGRRGLNGGNPQPAADGLVSALSLWRGRPWTELGESPRVSGARTRLAELREVAVEELQAARLAVGDTARAVAELSRAVVDEPYRERRWELLALALYRSGRQAHALAELRRVRALLREELGVEPGPALRDLEQRMLDHDETLLPVEAPAPIDSSPDGIEPPVIGRPRSRFIGRRHESALLGKVLDECRMVTIVGPPGVGKTRLAVEYLAGRADAWLVRLADVRDAGAIAPAAAAAVGFTGASADPVATLVHALADRSGVLALDNCEHLIDGVDEFVLQVLSRCPRLRILATSRRPTGTEGEQLMSLPPLPVGDEHDGASELFVERARARRPQWEPSAADLEVVRAICANLDGLPLAIELAAARAHAVGLVELREQLGQRLDILGATPRGSLSPFPSLQAAIGWSIDRLPDAARSLLIRMWPFNSGFSWEAAEWVRGAHGAIFADLADLVDCSVLSADVGSGRARYRMLETIRHYCRQIDPAPAETAAAHAEWVRHFIGEQVPLFCGPRFREAFRALAVESDNIRVGITHDLEHAPQQALRSAGSLSYMWVTVGAVPEARDILQQALRACPTAPVEDRAQALITLALTSSHMGDAATTLDCAESALALLDPAYPEHDRLLLEAHLRRCNALADTNDMEALRSAATEFADACAVRDAPQYLRVTALWGIALVQHHDGRFADAIETFTRAHEISVRHDFTSGAGITDLLLAWCLLADPPPDRPTLRRALDLLIRSIMYFDQQPNFSEQLAALLAGTFALAELGAHDAAAPLHAAVTAHSARLGIDPRRYIGFAGPNLADRLDSTLDYRAEPGAPPLPWAAMILLFTDAVAALPQRL